MAVYIATLPSYRYTHALVYPTGLATDVHNIRVSNKEFATYDRDVLSSSSIDWKHYVVASSRNSRMICKPESDGSLQTRQHGSGKRCTESDDVIRHMNKACHEKQVASELDVAT
jgi:hypothetical protein